MPLLYHPENDIDRFTFISTCSTSIIDDELQGKPLLTPQTAEKVHSAVAQMKVAMSKLDKEKAVRSLEVIEKNSALKEGTLFLNDFWTVLTHRVNRENLPASVLKYYGLPLTGIRPRVYATPSIVPYIEKVIDGDRNAVEAGYNPMANPSAEEMSRVLQSVKKELSDVSVSDKVVDVLEQELHDLRENVDKLIRDVVAELRFFLRDENESSMRRIMRKYGVIFKSEKEESEE